jgi:hypothetical protein
MFKTLGAVASLSKRVAGYDLVPEPEPEPAPFCFVLHGSL